MVLETGQLRKMSRTMIKPTELHPTSVCKIRRKQDDKFRELCWGLVKICSNCSPTGTAAKDWWQNRNVWKIKKDLIKKMRRTCQSDNPTIMSNRQEERWPAEVGWLDHSECEIPAAYPNTRSQTSNGTDPQQACLEHMFHMWVREPQSGI